MIRLSIQQDDVLSVYSGKPGCACGCRGKYSYASKLVAEASKNRGYKVTPDEVSDKNIKRMSEGYDAQVETRKQQEQQKPESR